VAVYSRWISLVSTATVSCHDYFGLFGLKPDITAEIFDVRFMPKSDSKAGIGALNSGPAKRLSSVGKFIRSNCIGT
jgi:hypothetical protein